MVLVGMELDTEGNLLSRRKILEKPPPAALGIDITITNSPYHQEIQDTIRERNRIRKGWQKNRQDHDLHRLVVEENLEIKVKLTSHDEYKWQQNIIKCKRKCGNSSNKRGTKKSSIIVNGRNITNDLEKIYTLANKNEEINNIHIFDKRQIELANKSKSKQKLRQLITVEVQTPIEDLTSPAEIRN